MSMRAAHVQIQDATLPQQTASSRPHRVMTSAKRPSLSPALYSLAAIWIATRLTTQHVVGAYLEDGEYQSAAIQALIICACASAVLACACIILRKARPVLVVLAISTPLGACCSVFAALNTIGGEQILSAIPASSIELLVTTDPRPSATGSWNFHAKVYEKGTTRGIGQVLVSAPAEQIRASKARLGSIVRVVGRWSNFSSDDYGTQEVCRGTALRLKAVRLYHVGWQTGPIGLLRAARAKALDALDHNDAGPGTQLVAGVVLGYTTDLAQGTVSDDFRALGLTHLVAVSGTHMAVVAGVLGAFLRVTKMRPGARALATVTCLGCYVVLSGVQPSAVRSYAMVCLALASGLVLRRAHALSALSLVSTAMILIEPASVFQLGFVLSVLSVLGIACFARFAADWVAALFSWRVPRAVTDVAAVTFVAQAFTLPVTLPTFSVFPLASPLANLLVGPLMTALLVYGIGAVTACSFVTSLTSLMLVPAEFLGTVVAHIASALTAIPYSAFPVSPPAGVCALTLLVLVTATYYFWPVPSARTARIASVCALALCLGIFLRLRFFAPQRMIVLDVGQGDAILVQSGASSILVDTGPGNAVVSALGRHGVIHLDAVLLTHTDSDHVGGLQSLERLVDVDNVVLACGVPDAMQVGEDQALLKTINRIANKDIVTVLAGDELVFGAAHMQILWPASPVPGDKNEDSIVARLSFSSQTHLSCLLCGDAEQEVLEPLSLAGKIENCDVLKVGHHGSAVSVGPELLAFCDPGLALASAGEGNRYGHPTEQCRATLRQAGVPFLCTIWSGDVTVKPGADEPSVSVQSGSVATGIMAAR